MDEKTNHVDSERADERDPESADGALAERIGSRSRLSSEDGSDPGADELKESGVAPVGVSGVDVVAISPGETAGRAPPGRRGAPPPANRGSIFGGLSPLVF